MKRSLGGILTSAALGLALLMPSAASAQVAGPGGAAALKEVAGGTTEVQYRGGWRGHRGGWRGHRGGWRGHRGGWRGNRGAGIGLGIAAGAIIGGAIAAQRAPVYAGDADAYCASRFRSYDPASGTYLGYDGIRHACP